VKNLILAASAAVLLASPVLAQSNVAPFADPHERTQGNQSHLGGDNQQSGGPRESRAQGFGAPYGSGVVRGAPGVVIVDPVETGSIVVAPADPSVPGSSTASPFSRTQGNNAHTGGDLVPSFQQGSSQESGGPANELIPRR
jgi:glucose/arabinose dehydrogenase